jgi:hypothetical protein
MRPEDYDDTSYDRVSSLPTLDSSIMRVLVIVILLNCRRGEINGGAIYQKSAIMSIANLP